jgi:hypothetical protein
MPLGHSLHEDSLPFLVEVLEKAGEQVTDLHVSSSLRVWDCWQEVSICFR